MRGSPLLRSRPKAPIAGRAADSAADAVVAAAAVAAAFCGGPDLCGTGLSSVGFAAQAASTASAASEAVCHDTTLISDQPALTRRRASYVSVALLRQRVSRAGAGCGARFGAAHARLVARASAACSGRHRQLVRERAPVGGGARRALTRLGAQIQKGDDGVGPQKTHSLVYRPIR